MSISVWLLSGSHPASVTSEASQLVVAQTSGAGAGASAGEYWRSVSSGTTSAAQASSAVRRTRGIEPVVEPDPSGAGTTRSMTSSIAATPDALSLAPSVAFMNSSRWTLMNRGTSRYAETAIAAVSYTHLRAHETRHDLVCRL